MMMMMIIIITITFECSFLLSDKQNCTDLVYLVYVWHCYMFRLCTSAIINQVGQKKSKRGEA